MLNSAKIMPADQRTCAISEKISGGWGGGGRTRRAPPLDPPFDKALYVSGPALTRRSGFRKLLSTYFTADT